MPIFAHPFALLGLLSVPILAGIYLLQRRRRRLEVSALFLWDRAQPPRQGGTHLLPARLPWLFLLEAAILVLLALAAAQPLVPRRSARRELLVVLDASLRMAAPGPSGAPAAEKARRILHREFRAEPWARIRVIEARAAPETRVDVADAAAARAALGAYQPDAPASDLASALALAARLAGPADSILAVTDRAPDPPPADPRLRWTAVGTPLPNQAFVGALRGPDADGRDTCLVEVANFGGALPRVDVLLVENSQAERAEAFPLAAGERRRVRIRPPPGNGPVQLRLAPGDAFPFDNEVHLCAPPDDPITVRLAPVIDAADRALFARAVRAAGLARLVDEGDGAAADGRMHLEVLDAGAEPPYAPWTLVWHRPAGARPLAGPFLRTLWHPLTEELDPAGAWWGAEPGYPVPGRPLLTAADATPLLSVEDGPVLHLHWSPRHSTFQRMPDWPILVDNLLRWRAEARPQGMPRNLPLGATLTWPVDGGAVTVHGPGGSRRRIHAREGRAVLDPPAPGLYRIELPDGDTFPLAVNLLAPGISDLRPRGSGSWGERFSPSGQAQARVSIAWALLLAAAALAGVHTLLVMPGAAP